MSVCLLIVGLTGAAALSTPVPVRRITPVTPVTKLQPIGLGAAALAASLLHPPAVLAWGKAAAKAPPPTLAAVVSARATAAGAVVAAAWTKYTAIVVAAVVAAYEAVLAVNYGAALAGITAEAARLGGAVSQWVSSTPTAAAVKWGAASARVGAASATATAAVSARVAALAATGPLSPTQIYVLAAAVPAAVLAVGARAVLLKARASATRTTDELYSDLQAALPMPVPPLPGRWMAVRGLPEGVPPHRLLLAFPHARRVEAVYAADGTRGAVLVEVDPAGASLRRSVTPPCSLEPLPGPPPPPAGAQRKVCRAASSRSSRRRRAAPKEKNGSGTETGAGGREMQREGRGMAGARG